MTNSISLARSLPRAEERNTVVNGSASAAGCAPLRASGGASASRQGEHVCAASRRSQSSTGGCPVASPSRTKGSRFVCNASPTCWAVSAARLFPHSDCGLLPKTGRTGRRGYPLQSLRLAGQSPDGGGE